MIDREHHRHCHDRPRPHHFTPGEDWFIVIVFNVITILIVPAPTQGEDFESSSPSPMPWACFSNYVPSVIDVDSCDRLGYGY
jgi:hypothetical protein